MLHAGGGALAAMPRNSGVATLPGGSCVEKADRQQVTTEL